MDTLRPRDFDDMAALEQPSIVVSMWRYRWLVLFVVVVFIILGLAFQAWVPQGFQAQATMTVEDPRNANIPTLGQLNPQSPSSPQRYVADQVGIIESPRVAARASETVDRWASSRPEDLPVWLGLDAIQGVQISDASFIRNTRVTSNDDSNIIEVAFTAETAELAQIGANAMIEAYRTVREEDLRQTANAAVLQIQDNEDALNLELEALRLEIAQLQEQDVTRAALDADFAEDVATFQVLQERLDELNAEDPTSEEAEGVRQQMADLQQAFASYEVINRIFGQDARVLELLAKQDQAIAELANLAGDANAILIAFELQGAGITSASLADTPRVPIGSGPLRILAASLVLGLAVAAALSYFLAARRRSFSSRELPEMVLGVPLLAEVPDFTLEGIKSSLPVTHAPTSASAEAFRFAAAAVDIRASAAGAKSLMMVSATLGSGKTTAAANTAIAAAREGLRVLVIDADFGNQELTSMFLGAEQPPAGITEVVEGLVPLEKAVTKVVVTDDRSLYLLWRGRRPVEAANFFRTEATQQFFRAVKDQFDLVIIDGPPLLQVAYASTLVRYVDSVVVIVGHNSRVGELEEVGDRLQFIETPALGYIYTRAPLRAEMTASEGSMKDILGVGGQPASQTNRSSRRPAATSGRRRNGNGSR